MIQKLNMQKKLMLHKDKILAEANENKPLDPHAPNEQPAPRPSRSTKKQSTLMLQAMKSILHKEITQDLNKFAKFLLVYSLIYMMILIVFVGIEVHILVTTFNASCDIVLWIWYTCKLIIDVFLLIYHIGGLYNAIYYLRSICNETMPLIQNANKEICFKNLKFLPHKYNGFNVSVFMIILLGFFFYSNSIDQCLNMVSTLKLIQLLFGFVFLLSFGLSKIPKKEEEKESSN